MVTYNTTENHLEPNLVRTSTLSPDFIRKHIDIVNTPIRLNVAPNVIDMQRGWSEEEISKERRLVELKIARKNYANFDILARPIHPSLFSESGSDPVISCIYWEEKGVHVVTSVDMILVLEYLVGEPFSIEEKSRVRRNLQFLKPYTITKSSPESRRLFSSLMSMENPRPRNIEKGLKVFKWTDLFVAINRVLSKYSSNPKTVASNQHLYVSPGIQYASKPFDISANGSLSNCYPLRGPASSSFTRSETKPSASPIASNTFTELPKSFQYGDGDCPSSIFEQSCGKQQKHPFREQEPRFWHLRPGSLRTPASNPFGFQIAQV